MTEVAKKIYEILSEILELEVNETTQYSMKNCEKWSSLSHIDIIMSIEEEFGIMFQENDLEHTTSQIELVQKVQELLA